MRSLVFTRASGPWTLLLFLDEAMGGDSVEDCPKKVWTTTKIGTLAGLGISVYDVLMYSHPQGYLQTALRIGQWTVPLAVMGAAFGAGTCIATDFRKKDDEWNYVFGGILAGSVWGASRRRISSGLLSCATFGLIGAIYKNAQMHNIELFPLYMNKEAGDVRSPHRDWSLTGEYRDIKK